MLSLPSNSFTDFKKVDFNNLDSFLFTKPVDVFISEKHEFSVNSWSKAYAVIFGFFESEYKDIIPLRISLLETNKIDYGDRVDSQEMRRPVQISEDRFIETNICADGILKRIKALLDLCCISYDDVVIFYQSNKEKDKFAINDQKDFSECNLHNEIKPIEVKSYDQTESMPIDPNKYIDILENFFKDGLVPNAIKLDKFREKFKEKFKEELSEDNDYLIDQLNLVGQLIHGRIYPAYKHDSRLLIEEIRKEILDTFKNGATCVYFRSIMQRWHSVLTEQLNIYSEEALRDLLLSGYMPGVFANNEMLKLTQKKVLPTKDVLDFMRSTYSPVTSDDIQKHLWYIPIEEVLKVLRNEKSLVIVDTNTYIYAPNFPASPSELNVLIKKMSAKIEDKGFLIAKDIVQIISDNCPAIVINTVGYKDRAYRNVLSYILRDFFEFGTYFVTLKGQKMDMNRVFLNFCRDYDFFTLDMLNQFSKDIGRQISLDDVLSVMVRVNSDEFIRRSLIHFDVDAVDKVLDSICPDDYISIGQVGHFLLFPIVEYPWNEYLLESYLSISKIFDLFHVCYSVQGVYGAVVRKTSTFKNYHEILVDLLARNNDWSDYDSALSIIVEKGYQARKRFADFEKILHEALLLREKINKKGN